MEGKGLPRRSKGSTIPAPNVHSDKPRWEERCRAEWKPWARPTERSRCRSLQEIQGCQWLASCEQEPTRHGLLPWRAWHESIS